MLREAKNRNHGIEHERTDTIKLIDDNAVLSETPCPFNRVNPSINLWKCDCCSAALSLAESIKKAKSGYRTGTEQMYANACLFPVLQFKGVEDGSIPGITPYEFNADKLADFLKNGHGRAWSSGETHVLEFLLNLANPNIYDRFNFGRAFNTWDCGQVSAFITAVQMIEYGE